MQHQVEAVLVQVSGRRSSNWVEITAEGEVSSKVTVVRQIQRSHIALPAARSLEGPKGSGTLLGLLVRGVEAWLPCTEAKKVKLILSSSRLQCLGGCLGSAASV